jgi:hypothetical protein
MYVLGFNSERHLLLGASSVTNPDSVTVIGMDRLGCRPVFWEKADEEVRFGCVCPHCGHSSVVPGFERLKSALGG